MLLYTMNNYTIRILLFLFGCIGARIMLAYIVQLYGIQYKNDDEEYFQSILKKSQLTEFVNQLPDGVETKVE